MKNFVKLSLLAAMAVAPVMADESFGGIGVTIYQIHEGVKVAEVIPGKDREKELVQTNEFGLVLNMLPNKKAKIKLSVAQKCLIHIFMTLLFA